MRRTGPGRRAVLFATLFTMLFSAVSPALAAAFLSHCPAALGTMLGLHAAASRSGTDACPQAAPGGARHHGNEAQPRGDSHHDGHDTGPASHASHDAPPDDRARHDAHGIYCALCLPASSVVALTAAALAFDLTHAIHEAPLPDGATAIRVAFHPPFHSRAPPQLNRSAF